MKPTAAIAITAVSAAAAFFIGRMTAAPDGDGGKGGAGAGNVGESHAGSRGEGARDAERVGGRARREREPREDGKRDGMDRDPARMTREERLALLARSVTMFNKGDGMVEVIRVLQAGEMRDAAGLIGQAQNKGIVQSPEVWTTLWRRWGEVDPLACFARFQEFPQGKGRTDLRNTMKGWLETDPMGALEWARNPERKGLEAAAAALALAHAAGGDPQKLQADLQGLPAGAMRKEVLKELYDLETLKEGGRGAADIYAGMPQEMKADAWGTTAERLGAEDPAAAKEWITQHAGEPGTNYASTMRTVWDLARKDPEATAKWAVTLPESGNALELVDGPPHPVMDATYEWLRKDPAAAEAWVASLPAEAPTTAALVEMVEKRKK